MMAMKSQIIINNIQKDISRFSMGIVSYQGLIYIVGGCTHSRRHMQVHFKIFCLLLTMIVAAMMMIFDVMMMIEVMMMIFKVMVMIVVMMIF